MQLKNKINHLNKKILVSVIITILIICILSSQVNSGDLLNLILSSNPYLILMSFFCYSFSNFLRAYRFYILLNKKCQLKVIIPITFVHNMVNSIFPARTGELSYIFLMKKYSNERTGNTVATLLASRMFDMLAICFLFFVSSYFVKDLPPFFSILIQIIIFFCILLLFLSSIFFLKGDRVLSLIGKIFHLLKIENKNLILKFFNISNDVNASIKEFNSKKLIIYALSVSFCIWISNFFMVYFVLSGLQIFLSLPTVILGSTFMLLTTLLPIQGIAGFGTSEGLWTLVFVPLGMSTSTAILSGFAYHIYYILFYIILGIIGFMFILREK